MPRYVLYVRRIINVPENGANSNGQEGEAGSKMPSTEASPEVPRQSQRERCPSHWLTDYETSCGVWSELKKKDVGRSVE